MAKAATPTKPVTPSQKATQNVAEKVKATEEAPKKMYPVPHCVIHHPNHEQFAKDFPGQMFAPALTIDFAKKLLGWESEADYIAKIKKVDANANEDQLKELFGKDKFLTDMLGNNVKLHNNTRNRQWGEGVSASYTQDILKKHWEFNGEDIIIGEFGRVLSGQHRLIAIVFAEQLRLNDKEKDHWVDYWKDQVQIPIAIMYGIEESGKVTRTIDNVYSRTLSHVISTDTSLLVGMKGPQLRTASRALDYATKFLWERTDVGNKKADSFAPKRTHSEALDFVDRHKKLIDCVKFIVQEEGEGSKISRFVFLGHAAALLYMMSTTGNDDKALENYAVKRPLNEKEIKFPSYQKAKMFWSDLAKGDVSLAPLIMAKRPLTGNDEASGFTGQVFPTIINDKLTGGDGTLPEFYGCIIRAWNAYIKDEQIETVELMYDIQLDPATGKNLYALKEFPTIQNSIDCGRKVKEVKKEATPDEPANPDAMTELTDEEGDAIAEQATETTNSKLTQARESWDKDKETYAGHILVYQSPLVSSNNFKILFDDAELWQGLTERKAFIPPHSGIPQVVCDPTELNADAEKVMAAGHNILVFSRPDEKGEVTISPFSLPEENESTENTQVQETPTNTEQPTQSQSPKKMIVRRK